LKIVQVKIKVGTLKTWGSVAFEHQSGVGRLVVDNVKSTEVKAREVILHQLNSNLSNLGRHRFTVVLDEDEAILEVTNLPVLDV
jgi:hypothetical protein